MSVHFDASRLDEASYLLRANEEERAKVISGGTDILRMMRLRYTPELPGVLVNLKTIPDLAYIKEENRVLKIVSTKHITATAGNYTVRQKVQWDNHEWVTIARLHSKLHHLR